MADSTEVLAALEEYTRLSNSNERLRRMNRDWSKHIHLRTTDTHEDFRMEVVGGEILSYGQGTPSQIDIQIQSTSEIFCDMFWGDLNPAQKYLSGELIVKGTQEDVMRLDAISAVIWPE